MAQEAVRREPLVVEHLREVAPSTVGQEHDDQRIRVVDPRGDLERGDGRHAARAADEQRLLPREPTRHRERLAVAHRDDLVADRPVVSVRPEVLAYALDEIGPTGAAGVDRALRVRADHLDPPAGLLLEIATGAAHRAARADAGHEVRDLPVGLRPKLRAGRAVVGLGVLRVAVLVWLPATGRLAGQSITDGVVRARVLGVDGCGAHLDLRAVRAQRVDLVLGDLVRADEDALVALGLGHDRQPDAGVARGRLHDRSARLELAGLLCRLDHAQRDPVLHGPAGVEVLDLGKHRGPDLAGHPAQPQEGRVADEIDEVVVDLHPASVVRRAPGRPVRAGRHASHAGLPTVARLVRSRNRRSPRPWGSSP